MTTEESKIWKKVRPFVFGGVSGMIATCVTQPIDTIKVRIQILGEEIAIRKTGPFGVAQRLISEEGFLTLYKGLDSALFRQATYTTARLGVFRSLMNWREDHYRGSIPLSEKVGISMFAGFAGSIVGNPADLVLVRFQADYTLPAETRRNYKNVFDAFGKIIKDEGIISLWKGSTPTIARAMALNVGQLSSFEELKEILTKIRGKNDVTTRLLAVTGCGIICSVISLPFDNVKTKLQKQNSGADGVMPYKGLIDCFTKSIVRKGFFGLWVGLPTYIMRITPHSIVTLLIMDFLFNTYGYGAKRKY